LARSSIFFAIGHKYNPINFLQKGLSAGQLLIDWKRNKTAAYARKQKQTTVASFVLHHLQADYVDLWRFLGKHLARVDGVIGDPAAQVYYYHTDHIGSIRKITDQQGQVVWNADYAAFGTQDYQNGSIAEFHSFSGAFV
jgi:hypothetical protein